MIKVINEKYLAAFGQHLKNIREEKKLSQRQLGKKANIDFNQVGRIERGQQNPTLSTLYVIAQALEIDPHILLKFPFHSK